ncbi:HAD family hydrolase [Sunxiuqinia sp. A32]|uniref:HAD family hydrolase n=1 Tax=Sunxiuqinia sp. A32 TaxID=3461496 RepID=UPI0040454F92
MKYKCVIFDCDGVLVDSERISAKVFQKMISELGCNLRFETILDQITGASMKENLNFFTEIVGKKLPDNFESEFRRRSYEAFGTELQAIEGVREILKNITVPVAVASSGPAEKIRRNLTTTNLIQWFDGAIYSCYDIGSWKPEPDIYLYVAEQMGFKPNDCAVIEDSITGVKAALNGGFKVYAYANDSNKMELQELGATVFFRMSELDDLLK